MSKNRADHRGRVVVITGASAGIGAATAIELLRDGWRVVAVDRSPAGFRRLAKPFPSDSAIVEGDVTDRLTHQQAAAAASKLGTLMGWVNNAGIERPTCAHNFSEADYDRMMSVNVRGYALGCSVACETFMRQKTPGAIVNVSSIRSTAAFPSGFVYETTKGAVDALTRSVAVEYGHLGIRCNAVRPGAIMTPMSRAELKASKHPKQLLKEWSALHPLQRRMGEPHEVAAAIAFLLSEKASFISGSFLNVDGAATARCYGYEPDPSIL